MVHLYQSRTKFVVVLVVSVSEFMKLRHPMVAWVHDFAIGQQVADSDYRQTPDPRHHKHLLVLISDYS